MKKKTISHDVQQTTECYEMTLMWHKVNQTASFQFVSTSHKNKRTYKRSYLNDHNNDQHSP